MNARPPRDPWQVFWSAATSDVLLAALLLAIALSLTATLWLPQDTGASPLLNARMMSRAQARFGGAAEAMQQLGLFTITASLGFRVLLAAVAGCLLLRLVEIGDVLRMAKPNRRAAVRATLAGICQVGALLVLAGLFITGVWGWQHPGLVIQSGEQIALPEGHGWIALSGDGQRVAAGPGIRAFVEGRGPGVALRAIGNAGQLLPIQQSPGAAPVTELSVALTEDADLGTRDALIAIPDAQLVVRLLPESGSDSGPDTPIVVQAYRSPSGDLAAQTELVGEATLPLDDVTLELISAPYVQLTATYSPGLVPTGVGLVALATGLLASIALSALSAGRLRMASRRAEEG